MHVRVVLVALCLVACGPANEDEVALADALDTQESPLNDELRDHPPAGAVMRIENGTNKIWVFACRSDGIMVRRTRTATSLGSWDTWKALTSAGDLHTGCATPPTVATIRTTPNDIVVLFWRSPTNRLIRAWYTASSQLQIDDLSFSGAFFGAILGAPMIVDVSDPKWIAVIVKDEYDQAYSVETFNNRYYVKPVLTGGGAIATNKSSHFVTSYNYDGTVPFVTMQENLGAHFIYTRSKWGTSFTQVGYTAAPPNGFPGGTLSFGSLGGLAACANVTCVIGRNPADSLLYYAPIGAGGLLSPQLLPFNPPGAAVALGGTPMTPPSGSYDEAVFARATNGHLMRYTATQKYDYGATGVVSAPALVNRSDHPQANRTIFYAKSNYSLWASDQNQPLGQNIIDMGLNLYAY